MNLSHLFLSSFTINLNGNNKININVTIHVSCKKEHISFLSKEVITEKQLINKKLRNNTKKIEKTKELTTNGQERQKSYKVVE